MTLHLRSRLLASVRFLFGTGGSLGDKTVRSGMWATLSNVLNRTLRLLRMVVLARLLAPDDFGLMGIVLFIAKSFDVLSQPGLSAAIIHRTDRLGEALDIAWTALIARGWILAGLVFAVAPYVATFYEEPVLTVLIRVVSCSFVIRSFANSHLILLRKELDFRRLAILEAGTASLEFVAVVLAAIVYRSVWALVVGYVLRELFTVIVSYAVTPGRPRFRLDRKLFAELFHYGKFITGAMALSYLSGNIDNAFLGKFLGKTQLGYYIVGYSLATIPMTQIGPVITRVIFPAFSKLQHELTRLGDTYLALLRLVASLTLPMAAGLAVLAPETVRVVYGAKWSPIVGTVGVLCVFGAVQALNVTAEQLFKATGRPHLTLLTAGMRLLLTIACIYPLTARYGIVGTAYAVTLPVCVEQLVVSYFASRILSVSLGRFVRTLGISALATGIMAVGVHGLRLAMHAASQRVILICCAGFGILLYMTLVAIFDRQLIESFRTHLRRILAAGTADKAQ